MARIQIREVSHPERYLGARAVEAHHVANALSKLPRVYSPREQILNTAFGMAFDHIISEWNREILKGKNPSVEYLSSLFMGAFIDSAKEGLIQYVLRHKRDPRETVITQEEYETYFHKGKKMLKAFQQTPAFGKPRPDVRVVLVNEKYGFVARGDFIDPERKVLYEVKTTTHHHSYPRAYWQVLMYLLAYPEVESAAIVYFESVGDTYRPQLRVITRDELDEYAVEKIRKKVVELAEKRGKFISPSTLASWKILEIPSLPDIPT